MAITRVVPLLVVSFLALYIFIDANKANRPILGFFFALSAYLPIPIGPIIYFLFVKPKLSISKKSSQSFCSRCGYSTTRKLSTCPKCQNSFTLN